MQDYQIAGEGKSRGGTGSRERWLSAPVPNDFWQSSCGDGVLLELLEVQLPNRKPQTGLDFVNGFRVATGEKLRHVGIRLSDN